MILKIGLWGLVMTLIMISGNRGDPNQITNRVCS